MAALVTAAAQILIHCARPHMIQSCQAAQSLNFPVTDSVRAYQ